MHRVKRRVVGRCGSCNAAGHEARKKSVEAPLTVGTHHHYDPRMAIRCKCDGSCVLCDDDGMIHIVDEVYSAAIGNRIEVPGRACLDCNSAWPKREGDDHAARHHAMGCPQVQS